MPRWLAKMHVHKRFASLLCNMPDEMARYIPSSGLIRCFIKVIEVLLNK